jgi:hypothetical protein
VNIQRPKYVKRNIIDLLKKQEELIIKEQDRERWRLLEEERSLRSRERAIHLDMEAAVINEVLGHATKGVPDVQSQFSMTREYEPYSDSVDEEPKRAAGPSPKRKKRVDLRRNKPFRTVIENPNRDTEKSSEWIQTLEGASSTFDFAVPSPTGSFGSIAFLDMDPKKAVADFKFEVPVFSAPKFESGPKAASPTSFNSRSKIQDTFGNTFKCTSPPQDLNGASPVLPQTEPAKGVPRSIPEVQEWRFVLVPKPVVEIPPATEEDPVAETKIVTSLPEQNMQSTALIMYPKYDFSTIMNMTKALERRFVLVSKSVVESLDAAEEDSIAGTKTETSLPEQNMQSTALIMYPEYDFCAMMNKTKASVQALTTKVLISMGQLKQASLAYLSNYLAANLVVWVKKRSILLQERKVNSWALIPYPKPVFSPKGMNVTESLPPTVKSAATLSAVPIIAKLRQFLRSYNNLLFLNFSSWILDMPIRAPGAVKNSRAILGKPRSFKPSYYSPLPSQYIMYSSWCSAMSNRAPQRSLRCQALVLYRKPDTVRATGTHNQKARAKPVCAKDEAVSEETSSQSPTTGGVVEVHIQPTAEEPQLLGSVQEPGETASMHDEKLDIATQASERHVDTSSEPKVQDKPLVHPFGEKRVGFTEEELGIVESSGSDEKAKDTSGESSSDYSPATTASDNTLNSVKNYQYVPLDIDEGTGLGASVSGKNMFFDAARIQIGTVSLPDFLQELVCTSDGQFTKTNIATAFLTLANDERDDIDLPPHTLPAGGISSVLSNKRMLKMIRLGNTKLSDFLALIDFQNGVANDAALSRAFKAAAKKEAATMEMVTSRIAL